MTAKQPKSPLKAVDPEPGARKTDGETIVRFVAAYLDTLPGTQKPTWQQAGQAFAELIERWRDDNLSPRQMQPVLLESATEIAFRYDLPVGNLLTEVTRSLASDHKTASKIGSTDERILEAAYEIFAEKGFYTATVDEIAQEAGVGKGTVYRHFDSKDNLFQAVVRGKLDDLVAEIRRAFETSDDVLQGIRRAVHAYLTFFQTHKRFYRILIFEQQGFGTEFRTEYIAGILQNAPIIRDLVVEASSGGRLKPLDEFYTIFYGFVKNHSRAQSTPPSGPPHAAVAK